MMWRSSLLFRSCLAWSLCMLLWCSTSACPSAVVDEPTNPDASQSEQGVTTERLADDVPETGLEVAAQEKAPDEPAPELPGEVLVEKAADAGLPDKGVPEVPSDAGCAPVKRRQATNIEYHKVQGVDPNLLSLDLVVPARRNGCVLAPVVVWVHGGGWAVGDKRNQIQEKAALLTQAGYALVSVNYRLSVRPKAGETKVEHPIHAKDVARALAWVWENVERFGGNPKQVAVLGHSAGAHLVALVATDESYLATHQKTLSQIRCVGSFDTEGYDIPSTMKTASTQQKNTYTNAFGSDPAVWRQASPITHAAKGKGIPPFLLAERGAQPRRTVLQAFVKALNDAGVKTQVIDAGTLDHAGVNAAIGKSGDTVMTPPLMAFLKTCFAP